MTCDCRAQDERGAQACSQRDTTGERHHRGDGRRSHGGSSTEVVSSARHWLRVREASARVQVAGRVRRRRWQAYATEKNATSGAYPLTPPLRARSLDAKPSYAGRNSTHVDGSSWEGAACVRPDRRTGLT